MRSLATVGLLAAAATLLGCTSPRTQANIAQALNDASTQISAVQQDMEDMQGEIDSLRRVVARQDTLIGRLAMLNNMPLTTR